MDVVAAMWFCTALSLYTVKEVSVYRSLHSLQFSLVITEIGLSKWKVLRHVMLTFSLLSWGLFFFFLMTYLKLNGTPKGEVLFKGVHT